MSERCGVRALKLCERAELRCQEETVETFPEFTSYEPLSTDAPDTVAEEPEEVVEQRPAPFEMTENQRLGGWMFLQNQLHEKMVALDIALQALATPREVPERLGDEIAESSGKSTRGEEARLMLAADSHRRINREPELQDAATSPEEASKDATPPTEAEKAPEEKREPELQDAATSPEAV
eukprot:Skav234549  [mRNA]  locus=scaffold2556:325935:330743:+ [translate_table: standard]